MARLLLKVIPASTHCIVPHSRTRSLHVNCKAKVSGKGYCKTFTSNHLNRNAVRLRQLNCFTSRASSLISKLVLDSAASMHKFMHRGCTINQVNGGHVGVTTGNLLWRCSVTY
jgi:hypothetical protein